MALGRDAASLLGGDVPFNGAAELLAHPLDLVQGAPPLLGVPALVQLLQTGQVRRVPLDAKLAAQDIGNALGVQVHLLMVIVWVGPLGVDAGVGHLSGDGRKCLAV